MELILFARQFNRTFRLLLWTQLLIGRFWLVYSSGESAQSLKNTVIWSEHRFEEWRKIILNIFSNPFTFCQIQLKSELFKIETFQTIFYEFLKFFLLFYHFFSKVS